MKVCWLAFALAGCGQIFGIDRIPYAGPADGNVPGDASDAATSDAGSPLALTVELQGSGSGTVNDDSGTIACGGGSTACSATFPAGAKVTLRPTASTSSAFDLWLGGCLGQNVNDNPAEPACTLDSGGAITVVADFESSTAEVLNLVPTSGTGADTNAYITAQYGGPCPSGQACIFTIEFATVSETITATGDTCAPFKDWRGGGCDGTSTGCTVEFNMSGNLDIVTVNYDFELGTGSGCTE